MVADDRLGAAMIATLSAGTLKSGLILLSNAAKAAHDGLADAAEDEQVAFDALGFFTPLIGGAFGTIAPILGPALVEAVALAIENNRSAEPGALVHIASGARGSDPFRDTSFGG